MKENKTLYKCRNCGQNLNTYKQNNIRNCECGEYVSLAKTETIEVDIQQLDDIQPLFPPSRPSDPLTNTPLFCTSSLVEEGFIFADPRLLGFEDLQISGRADTSRGLIFAFLKVNDRIDGWTSSEIMHALNWGPNKVRPRLCELFNGVKNQSGWKVTPSLDRIRVRMSRATGKNEYAYRLQKKLLEVQK